MKKLLATLIFLLGFATSGFATTMAVDFTSPGFIQGPSLWSLGFKFQANNSVTVTGLGVFDAYQNGLNGIQQVGLWDMQGNLLASTQVTTSDALQGFWRFRSLASSVTLTAGQTYYVASQGGEYYTYQTNGFTVNPNITYLQDSWNYRGHSSYTPLGFPSNSTGITQSQGGGYFGANLEFANPTSAQPSRVPEPTSVALLGVGLAGLVVRNRRKRG